jgi:hypothetical protein
MSPKVHAVVQNAGNFDLSVTDNTEEEKVTSTTTNSHGVQRMNAFGDFGTKSRARRRARCSENQSPPHWTGRRATGAQSPSLTAGPALGKDLVGYLAKVIVQIGKRLELLVTTSLQVIDTDLDGLTEGLEANAILDFAAFHESKSFAQDLACVLVSTGVDQLFDQLGLVLGENDISRRHNGSSDALA